jgi:cbb3-type cytochrome oxidase subunit 3
MWKIMLPDAPIVIVCAAAWFIINLFIILLVQIANILGSQKKKEKFEFLWS